MHYDLKYSSTIGTKWPFGEFWPWGSYTKLTRKCTTFDSAYQRKLDDFAEANLTTRSDAANGFVVATFDDILKSWTDSHITVRDYWWYLNKELKCGE